MDQSFSSKVMARAEFGQPLAPWDASGLVAVARPEQAKLKAAFSGKPESEIYAVVGEEGVGKSWIAAQTWTACDPRSILVICAADELLGPEATGNFEDFLIGKLIHQCGGQPLPRLTLRWQRRLKGWRENPSPDSVRITLLVDGLNQTLKADWSRWLDRAALELRRLGGCLVITTRSAHWAYLKGALSYKITEQSLGDWSIPEVKGILQGRGIETEGVGSEVLATIRNPRLLGIAVDLIEAKAVELLGELSVGRLLFEHMRTAERHGTAPITGPVFRDLLKELADKVLQRAQAQQPDDLRLFDTVKEIQLQAVASCRFFFPIKGSASKYEINPDGLNLGLALFLVDALETELRAKRDPGERLSVILEPISALDETAKVVLLAAQIACLDEETSPEVETALLVQFASMQNPPNGQADAFAVLARSAPASFLAACEGVFSSTKHYSSSEWLLYALLSHRDDPAVWNAISEAAKRWLSLYSLAPERRMFKTPGRDPEAEVNKERAKRQKDIQDKMDGLTDSERSFLKSNLIPIDRHNYDPLVKTAFHLLAGRALAGFAHHLVRWAFSDCLNAAIGAPDKEFRHLVRFNRLDWRETRKHLHRELDVFPEDNTSTVGKWVRVEVLRATGEAADAAQAERLAEWLTRDREYHPGWSLKEKYCAGRPLRSGVHQTRQCRCHRRRVQADRSFRLGERHEHARPGPFPGHGPARRGPLPS